MTWARSRSLLNSLRMDTLAASPRRHNACVTSAKSVLSQRRAYATGSEAPTEVEKILLDTIKVCLPKPCCQKGVVRECTEMYITYPMDRGMQLSSNRALLLGRPTEPMRRSL